MEKVENMVIFFDLDDTLTSFDSVSYEAWKTACEQPIQQHNLKITVEEMLSSLKGVKRQYWGTPERHKWGREHLVEARREVANLLLNEFDISNKAWGDLLGDTYTKLQDDMISLLPGVREALIKLRQKGVRMAVITNGKAKTQREKLDRFDIKKFFEEIFIDTEIGISKPDVGIYQFAMNKMNVKPDECVMVGDNLNWDIYGAQQAGIYAVWISGQEADSKDKEKVNPDLTVKSVSGMADYILNTFIL